MVMLALIRLGDAYGVPISREIEKQSGKSVAVASLYAALERLESKGLITSEFGEPTRVRGGRAKKYFRVTAKGIREVRMVRQTFEKMWKHLPELEGGKA